VMLPALALTVIADEIGQTLAQSVYGALQPYDAFNWVVSIGINTAFLSQIWFINIWPGSNGPFWSISYEFWFYLIFAVAMFSTGKWRFLLMMATLLVAGPTILGAFPIWFLGVALFMYLARHPGNLKTLAWPLWLVTWALAALAMWINAGTLLKNEFPADAEHARWGVNFWPVSYALGLLVTLNIYAFSGINAFGAFFSRHGRVIRIAADTSFGLYLFHYPLLYLTKAVLVSSGMSGYALGFAVLLIPFVASVLLAHYCEGFKPILRIWLEDILSRISLRMSVRLHSPEL
jgi:peptidoglycan/LPS O-acetylase OafA/YrhL